MMFMDVLQAAHKRRSIRRFTAQPVPTEALEEIVETARLAPTGTNRQPLQFAVIAQPSLCGRIFPHTHWAMRIPDGSAGPNEETQPRAYIALLVDQRIARQADTDAGAAAMSMLLAAESLGLCTCWLASIDRQEILALLSLGAERYALHTLIALGYPAMQSRAVPIQGESTDYYLEAPDRLCVPKRAAEEIIHWYR